MPIPNFKVGEMLHKRTKNSKTWMNFDGSFTTEIHYGAIHYEDENGYFQNVNTDLFDEADFDLIDVPVANEGKERFRQSKKESVEAKKKGIIDRDNHNFQGLMVPFDCHIPRNFQKGYTIGKGTNKLTFRPVKASPSKGYLSESDRSVITYQDVWNDTDVELKILTNGIKETIILKTDRAPFSFSFEVKGNLADDLTSGEMKLAPAWLQDFKGEKRDVEQNISRDGDKTYLDLVADVTGLTYPIEIDPTVVLQPNSTEGIDSYLTGGSTSNFATAPTLYVGTSTAGSNVDYRTIHKFDISSIPAGAIVSNATFQIYAVYFGASFGFNTFSVYPLTKPFVENQVDWFDAQDGIPWTTVGGDYNSGITHEAQIDNTIGWKSVLMTNLVNEWKNNANNGFIFKIKTAGGYNDHYFGYYSSDHATVSERPKLTITYNNPPTSPTVTLPNGGETWNSSHTITWNGSKDLETEIISDVPNDTAELNGAYAWEKVGQEFLINSPNTNYDLVDVDFYPMSNGDVTIQLWSVVSGTPTTMITSIVHNSVANQWNKAQLNVPNLVSGQKYAIVFENGTTYFALGSNNGNRYSQSLHVMQSGNWGINGVLDLLLKINHDTKISPQYQIQLTTDNGVTWKDIVALTSAGATSYAYDFINEVETSTAKIRIRAYDGSTYSTWDESNGVFTIQHNQAPTTPTNLSPNAIPKDRAAVNRLSWQHNDANADPQAQFDLQWRLQGSPTWNTISQVSTNQYWDAPVNTFPKGTIEWQVRTYDQAGLSSPYSNVVTFSAGDKPANPTITSPLNNSVIAVANPTVQWSSVGQTDYHLKVFDSANTLVWESIKSSTNKAETVLYNLVNGAANRIEMAIKNADGLWSDFVTVNITVSYTQPPMATFSITKDSIRGFISLAIDNPTPSETQPDISFNDVYRRKKIIEQEWTRIATNIPLDGVYTDYTPSSNQEYEYMIRAWGNNGTFSDSFTITSFVVFNHAQLSLVSDYEVWVPLKYNPEKSEGRKYTRTQMQFAGRKNPVTEFGENQNLDLNLKFEILNPEELNTLRYICDLNETLLYRDNRGRREFVTTDSLNVEDKKNSTWTVSILLSRVHYIESI
jgi:hypothetical protein